MLTSTYSQQGYGYPAGWLLGSAAPAGLSGGMQGAGNDPFSVPFATDDLLKMFEEQIDNAAASAQTMRRVSTALNERYAEITEQLKQVGEALEAELSVIHEQLLAEISAANHSPLVERCKRCYQALVTANASAIASALSTSVAGSTEAGNGAGRAADAYTRAVADLTTDLSRQLPAAYERYLTSVAQATADADFSGRMAAAYEELVHVMVDAYAEAGEPGPWATSDGGDQREEPVGRTQPNPATSVGGDADEALWASAREAGWATDGGEDDLWTTTAVAPTFEGGAESDWGAAAAPAAAGIASELEPAAIEPDGASSADEGESPWGSDFEVDWEDVVIGGDDPDSLADFRPSAVGDTESIAAAGEASPTPQKRPAKKAAAKKTPAKKASAKKAAKKAPAKKTQAKKAGAKKVAAKKTPAKKAAAKKAASQRPRRSDSE